MTSDQAAAYVVIAFNKISTYSLRSRSRDDLLDLLLADMHGMMVSYSPAEAEEIAMDILDKKGTNDEKMPIYEGGERDWQRKTCE